MEEISLFEYMKRTGILGIFAKLYANIPNNIEDFMTALDKEKLNYWSYSIDEVDEIKDKENIVLVYDIEGNKRYFELTETESF